MYDMLCFAIYVGIVIASTLILLLNFITVIIVANRRGSTAIDKYIVRFELIHDVAHFVLVLRLYLLHFFRSICTIFVQNAITLNLARIRCIVYFIFNSFFVNSISFTLYNILIINIAVNIITVFYSNQAIYIIC